MTSQLSDQALINAVKRRLRYESKLWGYDGELTKHAQNKLNGAAAIAFISPEHKAAKGLIDWRFAECRPAKEVAELLGVSTRTIERRIEAAFRDMCENIPEGLRQSLIGGHDERD